MNQDFKQEMRNTIITVMEEELDNPNSKWEWLKYKIQEFSITFTIQRNREQKATLNKLEKRLRHLVEKHDRLTQTQVSGCIKEVKGNSDNLLGLRICSCH